MKIVYLITGSGGSFYCGNCYRDMLFLRAIRKVEGITAKAIPLYLPPDKSSAETGFDNKVFFGAISMFLRDKVKFLRKMPSFFDKILDIAPLLRLASRQAGTTRTEGLEELTLNMIEGNNAFQPAEVKRLVKYLTDNGHPDIVHLSNALILGLAGQLKKHLDLKVVCSLLNEDDWIEEMKEPYRSKAWDLISRESKHIDRFVTPSNYYKNLFISKTGIDASKIDVVPIGFDASISLSSNKLNRPPAIGYFCRINRFNGFDKLVDAFIDLKKKNIIPDLVLNVCGGYTADDKSFILSQIQKVRNNGYAKFIKVFQEFQGPEMTEFFKSCDVISVPVRKYDGYGLYILEANHAGIPVIQPATGGFPEIISMTRGGLTYYPDTVEELSEALLKVLTDKSLRDELGKNGYQGVRDNLSLARMSAGLSEFYKKTVILN